jgi:hypothetical protein
MTSLSPCSVKERVWSVPMVIWLVATEHMRYPNAFFSIQGIGPKISAKPLGYARVRIGVNAFERCIGWITHDIQEHVPVCRKDKKSDRVFPERIYQFTASGVSTNLVNRHVPTRGLWSLSDARLWPAISSAASAIDASKNPPCERYERR